MDNSPLHAGPPPPPAPPLHPYDTENDVSGPLSICVEVSLVLANIFPILVVAKLKQPKDRLAGDEVVLALSVTDILSVAVPSPLGLAAYFGRRWYGGRRACDFYQVTTNWFQLASMCLVTYLCIDRCLALRRTMAFKPQASGLGKTRAVVALLYLITLGVSCLPLIGFAPEGLSPSGCLCRSVLLASSGERREGVFSIVFLVVGFTNLVVAVVVNSTVVYRLWRFKTDFGARSADRRINNLCADVDRRSVVEMTVMTLVVTLVFYLAWMPVLVMLLVWKSGLQLDMPAVLYALLSTTLTGLLNPVIYAIFSRSYRHGYRRLLQQLTHFLCPCTRPRMDLISDVSSHPKRPPPGGATTDAIPSFLPGELHETGSESDAVKACYENASLDCYLRLSVTEHMYALPAPPWAGRNSRNRKLSPTTQQNGTAKRNSGLVSYIQASEVGSRSAVESVVEQHVSNTEDSQLHDSLLEPDAELSLGHRSFHSSKLCLITTESEDSDADSEDVDTTEYNPPTQAIRRPDGYTATLQESMI